jgi:hypothetical protein
METNRLDAARFFPVLVLAIGLTLIGCGQEEPIKQSTSSNPKRDADALLLKDLARAGLELEQRLAASIQVQDGLLMIRDPVIKDLYVLPASSSWTLSCGFGGLSIVFGNSISGALIPQDVSSVGNDIELRLTDAKIDETDCTDLGLRLGKRLRATLQGEQQRP